MKKEKIGEMRIPTDELQKEYETLENQEDTIDSDPNVELSVNENDVANIAPSGQNTNVSVVDGATEIEPTTEELDQMNNPADTDPDYLEYSAEAVGYQDRSSQWDIYRGMVSYLEPDEENNLSIIDFGCGRGDFERFYETEYPDGDIDYIGIDSNQQMINAGVSAYEDEVELRCLDWFNLPKDLQEDWVINICSNNLRYDADTTKSDMEYLQATIDAMYKHAKRGIVIMLSTGLGHADGLINHPPVPILEWALKKYGLVTLDHSLGADLFTLIIYKN